jgi:hypothetical protein
MLALGRVAVYRVPGQPPRSQRICLVRYVRGVLWCRVHELTMGGVRKAEWSDGDPGVLR